MKNKKKILPLLALLIALNVNAMSLTGCQTKDEKREDTETVSETSVDIERIVVIDTLDPAVEKLNLEERYVILYQVNQKESLSPNDPNVRIRETQYVDATNQSRIGVLTEFINISENKNIENIFAYANLNPLLDNSSFIVKPTKDKTWLYNFDQIVTEDYKKSAYEIYELIEIFQILNEEYLYGDNEMEDNTIYLRTYNQQ